MQKNVTVAVVAAAALLVVIVGVLMQMGDDESEPELSLRRRAPTVAAKRPEPAGQPGVNTAPSALESSVASAERRSKSRSEMDRRTFLEQHETFLNSVRPSPKAAVDVKVAKPAKKDGTSLASEVTQKKENELDELKAILTAHDEADERASAAFFLGSSDDRAAIPILEEGLNDPDPEVRLAVVESLGDLSDFIQPEVLAPALNDGDPDVRLEAVTVLSDMETPEACKLLKMALEDPNEEVRMAAEGVCD